MLNQLKARQRQEKGANAASVTVTATATATPTGDVLKAYIETAIMTLSSNSTYTLGGTTAATMKIENGATMSGGVTKNGAAVLEEEKVARRRERHHPSYRK